MEVSTFSEVGGHARNEDAFVARPHPLAPDTVICVLADGQGGQRGGGPAAWRACEATVAAAERLPPDRLGDDRTWSGLIRVADEAVRVDPDAGFTTLVALCVSADRVVGASCGDSAALLLARGSVVQLTAAQRKNPPVGSGSAVPVPFEAALTAPWNLLVVSDGVWKFVGWDRLAELASRERGAALIAALQHAARDPGGRFQDDFTVIAVDPGP